jgi:hypothetical protein
VLIVLKNFGCWGGILYFPDFLKRLLPRILELFYVKCKMFVIAPLRVGKGWEATVAPLRVGKG